MIKNVWLTLIIWNGMLLLSGCSSVMSHTGGKEGTYPGTRASATMIGNDETNWGTKSLAILDMPFTAVMDTILLPWDIFRKDSSRAFRILCHVKNSTASSHYSAALQNKSPTATMS
ncbi:YceK/YidQ family lipoprotein, partial [Salmonella enterica]|uniref:YceK/YidQ family lipoprotein n=1 Tax=Salmonella enterica TaxID=28901 RepID=UPI003D2EAA5A